MAAGDTNQGLTVQIDGVAVGQVIDATADDSVISVDCTCLDDDRMDNRAGTGDISGSITIALKDSGTYTQAAGDIITFKVGALTARNVLIQSVSEGGGPNAARTVRMNFVSTEEAT